MDDLLNSPASPYQVRTAGRHPPRPWASSPGTREQDWLLWLGTAGQGVYRNQSGTQQLQPGLIGLIPPQDPGLFVSDQADPYDYRYCRFNGEYAIACARRLHARWQGRFTRLPKHLQIAQLIDRMGSLYRQQHVQTVGHAEVILAEILSRLLACWQQTQKPRCDLNSLRSWAYDHLDQAADCQELARHFGLSVSSLTRHCRRATGLSPLRFLQDVKLEWAIELLSHSGESIATIAQRVGYQDPLYFSRVFKSHFGISPRNWRQQAP